MQGRIWSDRILDGDMVKGEIETKSGYVFAAVGRWSCLEQHQPPGDIIEIRVKVLRNRQGN